MQSTPQDFHASLEAQRRSLEALVNQPEKSNFKSQLFAALTKTGMAAVNYFAGSNQPRIRVSQKGDRQIWHAYDPHTQQRHQFSSEESLRDWLEQRYYH